MKPDTPLSVLFVVPRFHTNLAAGVNALIDSGARVTVVAPKSAPKFEDHTRLTPIVVPDGITGDEMASIIASAAPNIAFVRPSKRVSRAAMSCLKKSGVRCYAYTLDAMTVIPEAKRISDLGPAGSDLIRVTPVRGTDRSAPTDPNARYLPLPVVGTPQPQIPLQPLKVLCVAKLGQPRKNHFHVIDALDRADVPGGYELTFVGASGGGENDVESASYRDKLIARAKESPPDRRIKIFADVPFAEMPRFYTNCNLCILASIPEALGISPLEAMAHGRMAIVSMQTGVAGEIEDGVNGLLVDMTVPGDLDRVVRRVAHDPELVTRLSDEAGRYAARHLAPETFVERVRALAA